MSTQHRPNVIWIFGDQHRAQSLGYRGDPNLNTPVLDNLARKGRRYDCAVAGAPWCSPFRGALLTSTYPHQNGVIKTPSPLDPKIPTITAPLREAGYHTAYVGKWHLNGSNGADIVPPDRRGGFDYWLGYENNNNQHQSYIHGSGCEKPVRLDGYETDALTDCFIQHLTDHVSSENAHREYQPFFATLSVQPPHSPYIPPHHPAYGRPRKPSEIQLRRNVPEIPWIQEQARLDIAGYSAMIENLDWNVGRILDALRSLRIDEETYILFFSDHGDMLGSHGHWEKSAPWEESIRIPCILSDVRGSFLGEQSDAPLNHVDIAPTTLGLCGIDQPDWMQGHDFSGHSSAPEPDSAYIQQITRKHHTLCPNKAWRGVVMRDGWKYVCTPDQDWMLTNTREDPCEQANFVHISAYQQQRVRCWDALQQWITKTGDDFPLPPRDLT